ncbi:MAG: peptide chain release factor 2, partial [Actinobacteria bacterium]|nr:peptide chain release factor 2 [Actinomycetota bacterium]
MTVDFDGEIKQLRATMATVREVTDLERLQVEIQELEAQASVPDLWDDVERAQKITSRMSRLKAEHDRVTGMDDRIEEL